MRRRHHPTPNVIVVSGSSQIAVGREAREHLGLSANDANGVLGVEAFAVIDAAPQAPRAHAAALARLTLEGEAMGVAEGGDVRGVLLPLAVPSMASKAQQNSRHPG
jgi:hypothetical protein